MSKADATKSVITSLRYGLSVLITIISVCIGMLVNDFRSDKIDLVTITASFFVVVALIASIYTQKEINKQSKELEDI